MEINNVSIYLLFMDLLVAYKNDPAGHNMAKYISQGMDIDGQLYRGKNFDLIEIDTPTISADWLDEKYDYDGFVFLSKHAAIHNTSKVFVGDSMCRVGNKKQAALCTLSYYRQKSFNEKLKILKKSIFYYF